MMRAVICKGDPTSHGGKVLEGNELVTTNGRAVAQKGHMTFCPQCKGNFPIAEGLDFHTYAGIGTAVDGMKTACGAKLIATQNQMVIDDGGGGGGRDGGGGGGAEGGDGGGKGMAAEAATKPGNATTPPEPKQNKYTKGGDSDDPTIPRGRRHTRRRLHRYHGPAERSSQGVL